MGSNSHLSPAPSDSGAFLVPSHKTHLAPCFDCSFHYLQETFIPVMEWGCRIDIPIPQNMTAHWPPHGPLFIRTLRRVWWVGIVIVIAPAVPEQSILLDSVEEARKQEGQQQGRERAWGAHPGESPPLELCSTTLASSDTPMMLPQGLCTDRSLCLECFSPDGHDLLSHLLHVFAKMLSSLCMLGHFSYVLLFATPGL